MATEIMASAYLHVARRGVWSWRSDDVVYWFCLGTVGGRDLEGGNGGDGVGVEGCGDGGAGGEMREGVR